ncbi:hypothetical protein [Clostridium massiliamazoniense]|uniref:hypothetical protein n=1 Tax=Clostridium massiliamazoniense TaxID=1347366 RepID=UPI0006D77D87|nr:hypothetical protein [Clostridium massiliamazoniense]
MDENKLKLAQADIDDAIKTIEDLESSIDNENVSTDLLKEKFVSLTEKVKELELVLKEEGII